LISRRPEANAYLKKEKTLLKDRSLILAGIFGLLSGLLTSAAAFHVPIGFASISPFVGIIFGVIACIHSLIFGSIRSPWKISGFISSSTLGFIAAIAAGGLAVALLHRLVLSRIDPHNYHNVAYWVGILLGGFVGTCVVAIGYSMFFAETQKQNSLFLRIGFVSLIGSILGLVGDKVGLIFGTLLPFQTNNNPEQAAFFWTFIVWQTVVLPLLNFLFPYDVISQRGYEKTSRSVDEGLPIWKKFIVVATILILLVLFVPRFRTAVRISRQETERKR
jgi:hypothetical protein